MPDVWSATVTGAAVATDKVRIDDRFPTTDASAATVFAMGTDVSLESLPLEGEGGTPTTERTLAAGAGDASVLRTRVLTMAAADPAVSTPTRERTVIAREFMLAFLPYRCPPTGSK